MGVNSLPKTVTRVFNPLKFVSIEHRGCDLSPGPTTPETSTLITWLALYGCRMVVVVVVRPYHCAL